jgi:hypothetical protein
LQSLYLSNQLSVESLKKAGRTPAKGGTTWRSYSR